jgi:hypothetical protein
MAGWPLLQVRKKLLLVVGEFYKHSHFSFLLFGIRQPNQVLNLYGLIIADAIACAYIE